MTHTLGYLTALDSTGNSELSGGNPGVYTVFDSLRARGDGTSLFGAGGTFTGTAADLVSEDVFFTGTNASLAYGGPVPIYAPSTFAAGSSIGHLDNFEGSGGGFVAGSALPDGESLWVRGDAANGPGFAASGAAVWKTGMTGRNSLEKNYCTGV